MKTFNYVSAPAGSGKTYSLSHHAVDKARRHVKVLIAQPSKRLIKQTEARIRAIDPNAKLTSIYGTDERDGVVLKVQNHIDNATPNEGEILIISHVALKRLSLANRRFWDLYIDEIPTVFDKIELKIARTHQHVTPFLTAAELVPGISILTANEPVRVDELIANPTGDQNIATFTDLLSAIQDRDRMVCIRSGAYDDLLNNPATVGHMNFFAILTDGFVEGFNDVTVMGANAEVSEMLVLWSKILNVEFVQHETLSANLLYRTHENGERLTINYLFDKWSKAYSTSGDEDETVLHRVRDVVDQYLDGRKFLWQANKSASDALFDPRLRLPHQAHGLDQADYRDCHNVVLLSALNHSNPAYAFLDLLGIDRETADITLGYQSDYQTMMRCSLRDPNATAPVTVIVASKGSADWLAERFPGCSVVPLKHDIEGPQPRGRPPTGKALTSTERSRLRRALQKGLV